MNRFAVFYYHPNWPWPHVMTLDAESQEAAEKEAQRRLDDREPLGWKERRAERVPWEPGIRLLYVIDEGPVVPNDDSDIPF
jgi:hypothetical protein